MSLENFNWRFYFTYYFIDFYKYFKDTEQWFANYLSRCQGSVPQKAFWLVNV